MSHKKGNYSHLAQNIPHTNNDMEDKFISTQGCTSHTSIHKNDSLIRCKKLSNWEAFSSKNYIPSTKPHHYTWCNLNGKADTFSCSSNHQNTQQYSGTCRQSCCVTWNLRYRKYHKLRRQSRLNMSNGMVSTFRRGFSQRNEVYTGSCWLTVNDELKLCMIGSYQRRFNMWRMSTHRPDKVNLLRRRKKYRYICIIW